MKKTRTKLNLSKNTIVSLDIKMQEVVRGGFVRSATESAPGADCPSERNSCNLSCQGYPKCSPS